MATIIKHGDGYQTKIRRKGFTPVSKTFPSRQQAKDWGIATEAEMLRGQYVSRYSAENTTLGEALDRYATEVTSLKPGRDKELYRLKFLQKHPFSARFLSDLRPTDFIKYRDERRQSLRLNLSNKDKAIAEAARKGRRVASLPPKFFVSDCTVRKELRLISHLFNIAKRRWSIFVDNPIQAMELPSEGEPRSIRVEPSQFAALMIAFDTFKNPFIKPLILFLVETALRRGEALSLQWADVQIGNQFVLLRKGKNQKPRRVPLSTRAIKILQELTRTEDNPTIFPITGNVVKLSMRHALKRAGLEGSGICTHTLRHEACSRLADRGFTGLEIAMVSGHKTLQLVERYAHLGMKQVADKMG